jgi:hypothetical protein
MAVRVTITLDEDVAAEIQKAADRNGRSLEEAAADSLRALVRPRLVSTPTKPFEVRTKALHLRSGLSLDNIEELLEYAEGPAHR